MLKARGVVGDCMIFYDRTGIRKWVTYVVLITAFLGVVVPFLLVGIHIFTASTYGPITHGTPRLVDPRFQKTIALTFDDGPHPTHTPALIKALTEAGVPATFFLLGRNVVTYPEVARSISDSGFEIGNHTYTHSENVHASRWRLQRELIAADRVIMKATGKSPTLYRPPYLLDTDVGIFDGSQLDEPALRWAEEAGFLSVGATIDSRDWEVVEGRMTLGEIAASIRPDGPNVLLFHDDGFGGKLPEMLPEFIAQLRAEGYTFVPVSTYFDLSPAEIVHTTQPSILDSVFISSISTMVRSASWLSVFLGIVSIIAIFRLFTLIALRKIAVPFLTRHPKGERQRVSVLVPAYNEAANIAATVRSVIAATRTGDEVIVIDDGSTDATADIVRTLLFQYPDRVILLQRENSGAKSAALSYAIPYARNEILVCIDGDTVVHANAFDHLASHFDDERVGAVAGKVYPAHARSVLSAIQYLEYVQGQNIDKEVFSAMNCVGVIPGALGAWRKSAVVEAGGFLPETVVEDQDLTLALLTRGWIIRYDSRAHAYTETPSTMRAFYNQRKRWVFGTLQCVWKYRGWLGSPTRPNVGWVILPNVIFFNLMLPILTPIVDGFLIAGLFGYVDVWLVLLPFLVLTLIDMWAAVESLTYEYRPLFRLIPLVLWQRILYRYVLAATVIRACALALAGTFVHWGHLQRRGDCHDTLSLLHGSPIQAPIPSPFSASVRTMSVTD